MWRRIVLASFMLITPLVGLLVLMTTSVAAATTANIVVTATPDFGGGGNPPPPLNFTAVETDSVYLSWTKAPTAVNTMIRVKYGEYPADRFDGYLVYYGNGESVTDSSVNFEVLASEVYYRAWSEDALGDWSTEPAEDWLFGGAMTLMALGILAIGLTVTMFLSKSAMLGFPSLLFWAILGGYAYTESTTAWGDWQYFLFFASFGMAIFCAFAAFALRTKKEESIEGDLYFDEGGDKDVKFIDEGGKSAETEPVSDDGEKPSRRTREIRDRASKRRTRWD